MKRLGVRLFMSLAVLSLFAAPVYAGPPSEEPVPRDCETVPEEQYNDRIDCRTENANVALFEYVDTVIEYDAMRRAYGRDPLLTASQQEHLESARVRAQKAKQRSHKAKSFAGQAKKQMAKDTDCYVKERLYDGSGDDVQPCVKGEICEEVVGDQIGNEDGACQTTGNPKDREACVRICGQVMSEEDPYDPDTAFDTEKGLQELEVVIEDATIEVKSAMARMQAYYATRPARQVDECETFEFGLFPPWYALQASQVAKNVADAVFNSCSVACNQDAFGWNCEAACVAFAVIAGVLNGIDDAFSVIDGGNGSDQLDRVAKCNRQLNQKLIAQQGALDDANAKLVEMAEKLDAMTKMIEDRFFVMEDLLCTPHGQRECFPGGLSKVAFDPSSEPLSKPGGTGKRR